MCDLCRTVWTRRSFLSGSVGTATAFALSPALLRGLATNSSTARPHLQIALEAWNWLDAHRIDIATGATWPADPTDPESTGYTLYTHSPGVLPFALELHHATGDQKYLDAAVAGAAHLAATLDQVEGAGLYTGLAGIAFVLTETWRATGQESHRTDAGGATARLLDLARPVGAGNRLAPGLRQRRDRVERHRQRHRRHRTRPALPSPGPPRTSPPWKQPKRPAADSSNARSRPTPACAGTCGPATPARCPTSRTAPRASPTSWPPCTGRPDRAISSTLPWPARDICNRSPRWMAAATGSSTHGPGATNSTTSPGATARSAPTASSASSPRPPATTNGATGSHAAHAVSWPPASPNSAPPGSGRTSASAAGRPVWPSTS